MVNVIKKGVVYRKGKGLEISDLNDEQIEPARKKTIAYPILTSHSTSDGDDLKIKFDAMASHDITYVGIIQTARASGLKEFPVPYVLTNCHNSLCAVGGTINEDDHVFGLSAAKKYGGIYVPAHQAVIHSYMREMMAGCGKMIIGSDSHTRYGALGTMAVGEGGPELVKQLLGRTYDIKRPGVIAVHLTGKPRAGIGPHDVAIALIGAVFKDGFVKNKVLEFIGDGIANLPIEFRNGIDVMTTETTCLSSIWVTDEETKRYYALHGRSEDFKALSPEDGAYYDGAVEIDLSKMESMIALPIHPSNAYTIKEFNANAKDILAEVSEKAAKELGVPTFSLVDKYHDGGVWADQGVIAGCAGGIFDNVCAAGDILRGKSIGCEAFALSVYPASQPAYLQLIKNGICADLMSAGATLRTAFCGPCFGAGDVPSNNGLSLRHTTRNFANREGSKPGEGQIASVALMDARSIAATAANGGKITAATDIDVEYKTYEYKFDRSVYTNRVYFGYGKANNEEKLILGPNITDWPEMVSLSDNLVLQVASYITDPVTTTDELIPSGESSSYRSNPHRLSELTLSRKDPAYVGRAKAIREVEYARRDGKKVFDGMLSKIAEKHGFNEENTVVGSVIFANKPGDGSAREQAASCQRVLGGCANIAVEYATKRYRSNVINWGMIPFTVDEAPEFSVGDYVVIPDIKSAVENALPTVTAYVYGENEKTLKLTMPELTDDERKIILAGCLINFYKY